jgi:hypothetical protein
VRALCSLSCAEVRCSTRQGWLSGWSSRGVFWRRVTKGGDLSLAGRDDSDQGLCGFRAERKAAARAVLFVSADTRRGAGFTCM